MDTLEIFQNLGFPIAVCAVLFMVLSFFIKKSIELIHEYHNESIEERKSHITHLQTINSELAKIIQDNTTALNKFSGILNKLIKE